ncbi:MAG: 2-oxoacid:acceptor oxidoreductase family protein [Thermofilum sp.]|jgi:pyruvate ferredoxin oxidoreductase gamma subunit|nr:2-oxoacid:acceptor oxidoreductase family protein [Thermofilum sp.]MCC6059182.1 2-oxoacid:acceptor oxidoreductase family protein [Thermofilum sp.]
MPETFDVVWLGRGGQGGVTAALILAQAAMSKGYYALAIPFFGAERRGAPVFAYNRLSKSTIYSRARVRAGDVLALLDPSLTGVVDVRSLVKPGGVLVVNSRGSVPGLEGLGRGQYCVDALEIAEELDLKVAGIPLVNMPMVGAVGRVSGLFELHDLLEATKAQIKAMLESNLRAVEEGWRRVEKCRC